MRAKRSLGQNFLVQPNTANKIARATGSISGKTILEIGPGRGILTRALLAEGAHVIAIEKDNTLAAELRTAFASEISSGKLTLAHADILKIQIAKLGLIDTPYRVIANIPYNITGAIIERLLSSPHRPESIALLVQREVAMRACALGGKQSILSLSISAFGTPRIAGIVKKDQFRPVPRVDSAILVVEGVSASFFDTVSEDDFFHTVRRGFAHKRKLLRSNLSIDASTLESCGISPDARAETLSLSAWKCVAKERKNFSTV